MSAENTYEKINEEYDLQNTFVYIERFKKKQSINEPYENDLHKPKIILSSIGNAHRGCKTPLYDLNKINQRDEGECKYGCQLIHLSTKELIRNVNDLKQSVNYFRHTFKNYMDPTEIMSLYAFRFVVFIKPKKGHVNNCVYLEVNTKLFMLCFSPGGCGINLSYPYPTYFHSI